MGSSTCIKDWVVQHVAAMSEKYERTDALWYNTHFFVLFIAFGDYVGYNNPEFVKSKNNGHF